eukprot:8881836-Pyramimonas_sp.AAC.1
MHTDHPPLVSPVHTTICLSNCKVKSDSTLQLAQRRSKTIERGDPGAVARSLIHGSRKIWNI